MSEDELLSDFQLRLPLWAYNNMPSKTKTDLIDWALGAERTPRLLSDFRSLSEAERDEIREWKQKHVSPKMARWIYETLLPDPHLFEEDPWLSLRTTLLWLIAVHKSQPSWKTSFFWREIEKNKTIRYGMWVVEAMSGLVGGIEDAPRLIALYEDKKACPEARGEALFALAYLASPSDSAWLEITHDVCLRALHDQELPYARAGATWLAAWTGRFEDEILALRSDETITIPGEGHTVGFYADSAYEDYQARY
jgi:hypothetical protein